MTILIADIGSNWKKSDEPREDLKAIEKQIVSAAKCGADIVKFQLYSGKELYGKEDENVDNYALPRECIPFIKDVCNDNHVGFMCSAFSIDGYKCVDQFVDVHKIASAEATDLKLVDYVKSLGKDFIISLGAINRGSIPWEATFIMHCVSDYPASPMEYVDKIKSLPDFTPFCLSDHTAPDDYSMAVLARYKDAKYVEVHFDCCKDPHNMTPDHPVSRGPGQLARYAFILNGKSNDTKEAFIENYSRQYNAEKNGYFRPRN